jgi:dephospho-CoA kinase
MLKLGLTGSIATGKSTVLDHIAQRGFPTFSSDAAVHRLYAGPAAAPIGELFPGIVHDGAVDRQELAARLVAAPDRLSEVEAIVHPMVRDEIASFFAQAERAGAALAVADIPLLFERGFDYGLDAVIVTTVGVDEQRRRALARPGMNVDKLDAILARQMPQAGKLARADHVIDTSGSIDDTYRAVDALLDTIVANQGAQ